jgi:ABC-type transport system involved in multi-copper enzyme maturation permease subunit
MITTLLKIEWRKVAKNRVFWAMFFIYFLALILALLGLQAMIVKTNENLQQTGIASIPLLPTNIYLFPHIWHNISFVARFFKILLAVVMIILVTNEYTYNTLRQHIITGLNRFEIIVAKIFDAIILSASSVVLLLVFGFIMGIINSTDYGMWDIFRKMNFLMAHFFQVLGFLSFAMMIAFIVKKSGLSIMLLLVYSYILELIPAFKYSDSFGDYLPLRSMNMLIEAPDTPIFELLNISSKSNHIDINHLAATVIYTFVFWGISYLVVSKRDL